MTRQQREFCAFFEKEYKDRIVALSLGRLTCTKQEAGDAKVELPAGGKDLWGLLIAGEKAVHFYAHASESAMAAMFRSASGGREPHSQYLKIPHETLTALDVSPEKNGFWSRLFAQDCSVEFTYINAESRQIHLSVAIPDPGTELVGCLRLKAAEISAKSEDLPKTHL